MAWEVPIRRVGASLGSGDYDELRIETERGDVAAREYPAAGARAGVVLVGGAGGGWDTPARGLYPRVAATLADENVAALRIRFRNPRDLDEATHDVLAGLSVLRGKGVRVLGLVGHSLGGAVVIRAAALADEVRAAVALATQSLGTDAAPRLAPRCALLLLHGTADRVLPVACSEEVYELAHEPKRMHLYEGADHGLEEAAEQVEREVLGFLRDRLRAA